MASQERSILGTVRDYYNSAETVLKFNLWGADPRRRGVYAAHLGLEDVERFHRNLLRRIIEVIRHRKAVARMTRFMIIESQIEDGQAVLDAGCGTGSVTFPIAEENRRSRVFSTTISRTQLEIMRAYQQSAGVSNVYLSEQNYMRMAFQDASFDRVIFGESFCHSPDKRETIREVARVLKPGGKVIIIDPIYRKPPAPDQDEVRQALESVEGLGMTNLPTVDELLGFIAASGMQTEDVLDLTPRVKASLALIADGYLRALSEGRTERSPLIASYLGWFVLTAHGSLGYYRIRATRSAQ